METNDHCFPAISFLSAALPRKNDARHVAFGRWDEAKKERTAFGSEQRLALRDDTPRPPLPLWSISSAIQLLAEAVRHRLVHQA
jgi:hypothetical protein